MLVVTAAQMLTACWRYGYWRSAGWGGGPVDAEQVSQYRATAEIIMGHGPKPTGGSRAFGALGVIANMQPTIKYPNTPGRG